MYDIIDKIYKKDAKSYYIKLSRYLDNNDKRFIITANPETIMTSKKNKNLAKILNGNIDIIPDGIGIIYAAKILKIDIKERITGYDTMINLLSLANQKKKSLYLFGAKEEVIKK